ncbi:MAG TPA: glycosyltransferase family 2 protein, partial [Candidatus Wallbacteria bacterium]|nr:glycosyltransferase family 2 protein [Candidatus Wallbacteria bacterium]
MNKGDTNFDKTGKISRGPELLRKTSRGEGYPAVTVITVVMNGAEYVEQTIQSVLGQNYPYTEYIIVDRGSTDGTVDIIKRYEDRISRWISEKDSGISEAFNKGVALAGGDYIIMMNSSDYFYDNRAIEKLANYIKINVPDENTIIYGGAVVINRVGGFDMCQADHENLSNDCSFCHQSVIMPRKMLLENKFDERLKYSMDYDLWLRLLDKGAKFVRIKDAVVSVYRTGGVSSNADGVIFKWIVRALNLRRVEVG